VDWRPGVTEGHLAANRLPAGHDAADDGVADDGVAELFTGVQAEDRRALLRQPLARLP
jgi:purine nucleosidase